MACFHTASVTCENCAHLRPPSTGHYMIATTGNTLVAATMHHVPKSSPIPGAPEMTWNQAAWSAGWAEGYQAGMQFVNAAAESEIERLQNERDELRACLLWYVESDDTNDAEYNAPWLKGKRRAMKALGLKVDE